MWLINKGGGGNASLLSIEIEGVYPLVKEAAENISDCAVVFGEEPWVHQ